MYNSNNYYILEKNYIILNYKMHLFGNTQGKFFASPCIVCQMVKNVHCNVNTLKIIRY